MVVLSDGMGGHSDGDIASHMIVSEVLGDLFLAASRPDALRRHGAEILRRALVSANDGLRAGVSQGAGQEGMGGTLVCGLFLDATLRWLSVGDSPLYLLRDGRLTRLNADHSLAPHIDLLAEQGAIDFETARDHPQRGVLTSALTGGTLEKVDCPDDSLQLEAGDIVLFASDGIASLTADEIEATLHRHRNRPPQFIADRLIAAVADCDEPGQDNVAVSVVTARAPAPVSLFQRLPQMPSLGMVRHMAARASRLVRPKGVG